MIDCRLTTGCGGALGRLPICMAVIASISCEQPSYAPDAWQGSIDTSASGVVYVSNPASGVWREGEGWRIVEDLGIGAAEGNGPTVFGEISSLGISPEGLIHVVDGHAQEVRASWESFCLM